jgi:DNA-binding NarL/FixJ family response regulator
MQDIGDHMLISRNTVKAHLVAIYRKQGVSSRGRAVLAARQRGVLPGDQEATSAGELQTCEARP